MKVGGDVFLLCVLFAGPLDARSFKVTSLPGVTMSLNCSNNRSNSPMFWYRQLSDQPPQPVMQSFTAQSSDHYLYNHPQEKFSSKEGHTLVIKNVSHEDSAVYYCVNLKQIPLRFTDGVHLIVEPERLYQKAEVFPVSLIVPAVLLAVMTPFAVYLAYRLTCKEKIKKNVRSCGSDPEVPQLEGGVQLEGDYQTLSHKDQAVYEVCAPQTNTKKQ